MGGWIPVSCYGHHSLIFIGRIGSQRPIQCYQELSLWTCLREAPHSCHGSARIECLLESRRVALPRFCAFIDHWSLISPMIKIRRFIMSLVHDPMRRFVWSDLTPRIWKTVLFRANRIYKELSFPSTVARFFHPKSHPYHTHHVVYYRWSAANWDSALHQWRGKHSRNIMIIRLHAH